MNSETPSKVFDPDHKNNFRIKYLGRHFRSHKR